MRDGKNENPPRHPCSAGFRSHEPDENLEYHFTEETGKRLLNLVGQ
jgi:hypothetical protein